MKRIALLYVIITLYLPPISIGQVQNDTSIFNIEQSLPDAEVGGETPTDPPPKCPGNCGSNVFDPYTQNIHREIKDLEVWGGTGQPLVWMRYGNSRRGAYTHYYGNAHNWNSSYQFEMRDTTADLQSRPQVLIHYPEGGQNLFVKVNATQWISQAGTDKQLFQDGDHFYLQNAQGYRYHFQKIVTGNSSYYQFKEFRDNNQNLYQLFYNSDRTLDSITEPAGRYLKLNYAPVNGMKVITKVSTKDGRSVQYKYSTVTNSVRLDSVLYGDGTYAVYIYNASFTFILPSLTRAIDPRYMEVAVNMEYTYVPGREGILQEEKNGITGQVMASLQITNGARTVCYPNGRIQKFDLPSTMLGRVKSYTDGAGNKKDYSYSQSTVGFVSGTTDGLGRTTTYNTRTIYGSPLEITYPDGSKEKWTRDSLDQVLTHTDQLGRVTIYTRDSKGRATRIDYPDTTYETFNYNIFSQILDYRKKNGGVEHYIYDSRGLKISFTDALGNITVYTYDGADRVASVTDARGNINRYEYNERGLLTKEINADLSYITHAYDQFGNDTAITNELGQTWKTIYDEFRRPKTKIDPLNRVTIYAYDLPGGVCGCAHSDNKPTKIISPGGKVVEYDYDLEWRLIRQTVGARSSEEASTFFEYDLLGNLVATIDPKGKKWVAGYDIRNRKVSTTDPLGSTTQYTYDVAGNRLTVKRPDTGVITTFYDNMDRVIQTTDPKGQITKMSYDASGNMAKLIDPKQNEYNFEFDLLDRKTKMIYPGGTFEQYTYNQVNNLSTYKNRNGDIRTYTYDNRNREILSDWSDATPDVSSSYDVTGQLISLLSNTSALSYTYNNAGELLSETQNITGTGTPKIVTYAYNEDGLRNKLVYPEGTIVTYGYTERNQVKIITTGSITPLTGYTYDLNGNRLTKTMNNGTNAIYTYDDANHLLKLDNRKSAISFARFNYGYDNVNRKSFVQYDTANGDVYTYDAIDQLMDVKYDVTNPGGTSSTPARTVNYILDPSGNRISLTENGILTNYSTNNLNQYTTVGANIITYTVNGNLLTFNGWGYTYDGQNRLAKVQKGTTIINFIYDPKNRCIKRIVNGTEVYYYYDNWNLIEERSSSQGLLSTYTHGSVIDEILIKTSFNNSVYYHHDALENTIRLTDNLGVVVEQYSYDIYGTPIIKNGSGSQITNSSYNNRFMFTGREYIQEISLYDLRNRFYSPELGNFIQTDPLRFAAEDINFYRYSKNNITNKTDNYGLDPSCEDAYNICMEETLERYKKTIEEFAKGRDRLLSGIESERRLGYQTCDLLGPAWSIQVITCKRLVDVPLGTAEGAIWTAFTALAAEATAFLLGEQAGCGALLACCVGGKKGP